MDRHQALHRLDLDDERAIQPVAAVERDALVTQRHGTLTLNPQPAQLQGLPTRDELSSP
jgi:hypothetical protein